jgi:copper chaperone NosL
MVRVFLHVTLLLSPLFLAACLNDTVSETPPPARLTMDATGYYCNMTVMDHAGSKGHVILNKDEEVFWFSSVRDTIAFTRLPGEPRDIAVIYVSDMSDVDDWSTPNLDVWIEAEKAFFVIGSSMMGGMGAPEPVPFSKQTAAESFVAEFGGMIVDLGSIPDHVVLGTSDMEIQLGEANNHSSEGHQ